MAPVASELSIADYYRLYGHESGWEFRSGLALRKPVPTRLHGLLQVLLGELLRLAGYISSVEVDVPLSNDWSPRPDVLGELDAGNEKYPRSVDVVFEVLSEGDDYLSKCRDYAATGRIGQIFVFNPEQRTIAEWDGDNLVPVVDVGLRNGVTITGARIWREMDIRRNAVPPSMTRI